MEWVPKYAADLHWSGDGNGSEEISLGNKAWLEACYDNEKVVKVEILWKGQDPQTKLRSA